MYRGADKVKEVTKRTPLGPYSRHMPRVLGGWAFSYERGTTVSKLPLWGGRRQVYRGADKVKEVTGALESDLRASYPWSPFPPEAGPSRTRSSHPDGMGGGGRCIAGRTK